MALLLLFVLLVLLSFSVLMVALRPSKAMGEVDQRLREVLVSSTKQASADAVVGQLETKSAGTFDWVESLLQDTGLLRRLQQLLLQAQSEWSPGGVIVSMILLGLAGSLACYLLVGSVPLAVLAYTSASAPYWLLRMKRSRRIHAFEEALPSAIEMCARSLRAGHSMAAAIGTLAEEAQEPVRMEFGEVFRKQNYGLPLRDALMELLERVPSPDLRILVTGILVQKDTGGNLPEIMDRIVNVIRDRVRIQAEVRTHTAQGRLTGWILCLLPPALLLLINLMNPGYSKVLLQDPMGRKLLYTGVGLLATGAFIIRRIVQGIEV
jgi:tight adherence protein B